MTLRHTPEQKLKIIEKIESAITIQKGCDHQGIPKSTYYYWKKRYDSQGTNGLIDQYIGSTNQPNKTPPHIESKIISLTKSGNYWSAGSIVTKLASARETISRDTVIKILERNNEYVYVKVYEIASMKYVSTVRRVRSWMPSSGHYNKGKYHYRIQK